MKLISALTKLLLSLIGYGSRVLAVDDYIERSSPFFEKEGFYEKEASRQTEMFGNIAHVFSTYESRHSPDDVKPFQAWNQQHAVDK